jgi:uncharacterized lipoprotein YddW (UPF0748 family)
MVRYITSGLSKLSFFIVTCLVLLFSCQNAFAQIGILNSNTSAKLYSDKHIGNYSELFQEIVYTFNNTNIKYNVISETDLKDVTVNSLNIIVLPLMADLSQEAYVELENYVKDGGKIILVFPDVAPSSTVGKLNDLIGVQVDLPKRTLCKTYVNSTTANYNFLENDFPASTKIATIKTPPDGTRNIAVWDESNNSPAITVTNNGGYIGWKWGNDGNLAFNVAAMKAALEALVPGIINKEQAKVSFKEFKDKVEEMDKLRQDTTDFLASLDSSQSSAILADIQEHIYLSKMQENSASSYYQNCEYEKAMSELKKAKLNVMYAYAKTIPSNIVEGRTLWLDRGTIVAIKNPQEMAQLFDRIQKIGINLVYFETLNAGYTIYPSKITQQNPLVAGWNPLYWAIQEAHKRNIELHAWTWVFAAGNTKHNPIVGKSYDYKGPLLTKNPGLLLTGKDGNALPSNQHEYWLDPSNPKARQLVLSILDEIVSNYQVDGIQLDYIRYPFQTNGNYMGFNQESRQKFEVETGHKLDKLDGATIRAWNEWKTKQVTKFVQDASTQLRRIRPDIKISAAVFGSSRGARLSTIQQDWETWVEKGWVDILNPMVYSSNTPKLVESINYINQAIGTKALVYPGIAIRQLEGDDLLEQIYAIKDYGLIGNTIFAMAHLGPEKSDLLAVGPYRYKEARVPSKDPLNSARVLVEEFLYEANNIKQNSKDTPAIYNFAGNVVITEAGKTHMYLLNAIDKPSAASTERTIAMIKSLENMTSNWLATDDNMKKAQIKVLTDYLKKAEMLLSYVQYHQNLKDPALKGNTLTNNVLPLWQ